MPTRPRWPALVSAVIACALSASVAQATEQTLMEPIWIGTVAADGTAGRTIPALLNLPPGWMLGDAAVMIVSDGLWPGPARERLVAPLLDEAAAVLDLDVNTARGFSPENSLTGPPATAEELVPDVRGAAETLRRDAGAGLVVALGHGPGGEAALLAASLERASRSHASALVAVASLGPGPARFALGGAAPGRGWPVRAELLCRLLAAAVPHERDAGAECLRALLGPGEAHAARAALP